MQKEGILTERLGLVVLNIVVFGHGEERALLTCTDLMVVSGVTRRFALAILVPQTIVKALFDFDALRFLKLVLLFKGVVGDDLVVDTVVELAIVIEFVLSVDLPALLAEAKHLLLDFHQLHDCATGR